MFIREAALSVVFLCCAASVADAAAVWQSSAIGELTGSRDSSGIVSMTTGGIDGQSVWEDGGLTVSWKITENNGIWTYKYTLTATEHDVSHWIVEVTDDGDPFHTYGGTSSIDGVAQSGWVGAPSNPGLPNDFYGIKFNAGGQNDSGLVQEYTIVTDREPVYGVGYWKDGKVDKVDVVAWTNSLNFADYKTNMSLTINDFIVRPNGAGTPPNPGTGQQIPEPGAAMLLLVAGAALASNRRRALSA